MGFLMPFIVVNGFSSRIVTVGGRHIATGDALFTQFQPIHDPRINWVGSSARRLTLSCWPYNPSWPSAGTVPRAHAESLTTSRALLTASRACRAASSRRPSCRNA